MVAKSPNALSDKESFSVEAILIGERIDLRGLAGGERLAAGPLTMSLEGGGIAVLFRFGAVVFFAASAETRKAFLDWLAPRVIQPFDQPEHETTDVRIVPTGFEGIESAEGNVLVLQDASVERLQIVADVLAQSVVLARYEAMVARDFDIVEPFAVELSRRGRTSADMRSLLRSIGRALLSEHTMVGRVEIGDKPELLWERPDLERLYQRLADEYELNERHAGLDRKLNLLARTAQTVSDLIHNRHSLRVEWYIVILILFDICLSLLEKYVF